MSPRFTSLQQATVGRPSLAYSKAFVTSLQHFPVPFGLFRLSRLLLSLSLVLCPVYSLGLVFMLVYVSVFSSDLFCATKERAAVSSYLHPKLASLITQQLKSLLIPDFLSHHCFDQRGVSKI